MAGLLGYTKSGFVVKAVLAVHLAFFFSPESLALSQEPVVSTYQQGGWNGLILNFPEARNLRDDVSSFPYRAFNLRYFIISHREPKSVGRNLNR